MTAVMRWRHTTYRSRTQTTSNSPAKKWCVSGCRGFSCPDRSSRLQEEADNGNNPWQGHHFLSLQGRYGAMHGCREYLLPAIQTCRCAERDLDHRLGPRCAWLALVLRDKSFREC